MSLPVFEVAGKKVCVWGQGEALARALRWLLRGWSRRSVTGLTPVGANAVAAEIRAMGAAGPRLPWRRH